MDNVDTTQQLGGGTFLGTNEGFDESIGRAGGTVPDFVGSDEVEFEFCLQIRNVDVNDGDTIDLKGTDKGTDYNSYTNIGRITVNKLVEITVEGAQPSATGGVTGQTDIAVAGNQPAGSAPVPGMSAFIALSGNQPASTGTVPGVSETRTSATSTARPTPCSAWCSILRARCSPSPAKRARPPDRRLPGKTKA